jgi:hypothetical protein
MADFKISIDEFQTGLLKEFQQSGVEIKNEVMHQNNLFKERIRGLEPEFVEKNSISKSVQERIRGLEPEFVEKNSISKSVQEGISNFRDDEFEDYRSKILNQNLGCQENIHVLAFYNPFHFHNKWGIYIKLKGGIGFLAKIIMNYSKDNGFPLEENEAVELALEKLILHEQGHYAVEIFFTEIEMNERNGKYIPYILKKKFNHPIQHDEEAFCNSVVGRNGIFKVVRKSKKGMPEKINIREIISCKPYIRKFMDQQPEGYNDYRNYIKRNFYHNSIIQLSNHMSIIDPKKIIGLDSTFKESLKKQELKKIPMYLLDDRHTFK